MKTTKTTEALLWVTVMVLAIIVAIQALFGSPGFFRNDYRKKNTMMSIKYYPDKDNQLEYDSVYVNGDTVKFYNCEDLIRTSVTYEKTKRCGKRCVGF